MPRFGRVLTAMVTPFTPEGQVDLDRARELAQRLVAEGNEGLVISGTTGEAPTLTDEEKISLFAAVIEAVDVPVIAGAGSNDTAHSVGLTREATRLGAAGILCVCPYYNRPSQAGIEAHITAMAQATNLPVMLYDIPIRSGRKISTELILKTARDLKNVVALKDAAGNPGETARVVAQAPAGFEVYSGDDGLTLPLLAIGAVGVVGVATHWTAPDHQQMFAALDARDLVEVRRINARMLESFSYETGDDAPNPVPTKAMLRHLGFDVGQCRLPMGPEPDWLAGRAAGVWANLQQRRAADAG